MSDFICRFLPYQKLATKVLVTATRKSVSEIRRRKLLFQDSHGRNQLRLSFT